MKSMREEESKIERDGVQVQNNMNELAKD